MSQKPIVALFLQPKIKFTLYWAYFALTNMKLSEFKFELPNNSIALDPAENRDEARLMVVHKDSGKIEHKIFKDIVDSFDDGDVMVGNDTMVFPARLYGRKEKTGAKIEVFLLRELNADMHLWDVLVDPARKIRVGNKLYFGNGDLVAEVVDVNDRAGDRQKVNQREQQQRAEKEGRVKLIANLELYDR